MPPTNSYPAALNSWLAPTSTTQRNSPDAPLSLSIVQLQEHAANIEAKLGIGVSTPPASAAVLRRTATGESAWGLVTAVDVAPSSIDVTKLAANAATQIGFTPLGTGATTTSSTMADVMNGGSPFRVSLTTLGGTNVLFLVTGTVQNTANLADVVLGVQLDNGGYGILAVVEPGTVGEQRAFAMSTAYMALAGGLHTFDVGWYVGAGGAASMPQAGLTVVEFRR
jgi:hypothetical protein